MCLAQGPQRSDASEAQTRTPPPPHTHTHAKNASDMIFLELNSDVKVTATQTKSTWHSTTLRSKHQIWDSYLKQYRRYAPDKFSRTEARGQGQAHRDKETVCDTLQPQYASTHQIWDSYLK